VYLFNLLWKKFCMPFLHTKMCSANVATICLTAHQVSLLLIMAARFIPLQVWSSFSTQTYAIRNKIFYIDVSTIRPWKIKHINWQTYTEWSILKLFNNYVWTAEVIQNMSIMASTQGFWMRWPWPISKDRLKKTTKHPRIAGNHIQTE